MPIVLSPRDLVCRPDNMDETVPHVKYHSILHRRVCVMSYQFENFQMNGCDSFLICALNIEYAYLLEPA